MKTFIYCQCILTAIIRKEILGSYTRFLISSTSRI